MFRHLIQFMAFCIVLVVASACSQFTPPVLPPAPTALPTVTPTALPTPTPSTELLLHGRWERVTPRNLTIPISAVLPDHLEFLEDGTWIASSMINGKYTLLEGERIRFEGMPISLILGFTISNNALTLNDDRFNAVSYRRSK